MKERIMNTIKKVMEKGAHYVIMGSFLTKFVAFFGSIFLVRLMSKLEYGILSYYENIYGYFLLAAGLGLAVGMLRYTVIAEQIEEKKTLYIYSMKRGELYNLILVIIFSAVCMLFPHPEEFRDSYVVGILLIVIIPFQYLLTLNLSILRGLFDYKSYAFMSLAASTIFILARVAGAKIYGLYGTVSFRLAAEILCAIGCVVFVYTKYFKSVLMNRNSILIKPLNTYSIQIMFTDGLWALFMLNDVFMLSQLSGDATMIADYKIAYVIPANLSLISSAIGVFAAPYFTKKDNEGDHRWVKKNLYKLEALTVGLMLVAIIFCMLLTRPIIMLLFGRQYLSCIPIFRILLISSLVNNGIRYTIANVYSAIGLQKKNLIIAGIGVISQIIINAVLIPDFGSTGVACGSVVVQIIMSIILILEIRKI